MVKLELFSSYPERDFDQIKNDRFIHKCGPIRKRGPRFFSPIFLYKKNLLHQPSLKTPARVQACVTVVLCSHAFNQDLGPLLVCMYRCPALKHSLRIENASNGAFVVKEKNQKFLNGQKCPCRLHHNNNRIITIIISSSIPWDYCCVLPPWFPVCYGRLFTSQRHKRNMTYV